MVSCYICETSCAKDDDSFVCTSCGIQCHQHCMDEYETDTCPKCVGEPMIGALEF